LSPLTEAVQSTSGAVRLCPTPFPKKGLAAHVKPLVAVAETKTDSLALKSS
jgi:hypothetical protein